jgi:hypothetical protein
VRRRRERTWLTCLGVLAFVAVLWWLGVLLTQFVWNGLALAMDWRLLGFWQAAAVNTLLWIVGSFFRSSSK